MDKLKKQKTQNNGQKHKETDRLKLKKHLDG